MTTKLNEIIEYANYLKSQHSQRNLNMDAMEKIYMMKWDDENRVKRTMENVKITLSPDGRNKVVGAVRLLIATDPAFSVPRDDAILDSGMSSKIEQAADRLWRLAGSIRGTPLHYDLLLSLVLYGEAHMGITATADMLNYSKSAPDAYKYQVEEIANQTPYLFDVYDPRTGYPDMGMYGLASFYREVETNATDIAAMYPDYKVDTGSRFSKRTLCHFWDSTEYACWVSGTSTPLRQEAHGYPFIPFVVATGEGSNILSEPEDQRQSFLYTLHKSGLWERQNLSLTIMYTMLFAMGANPMFVEHLSPDGLGVTYDFRQPGGKVTVPAGAGFEPLYSKGIIDPAMMTLLDVAEKKTDESTLYGQTLGEPLGDQSAFSMVALLHQAGRLPLIVPQRKGSLAIAEAVKIAIRWLKHDNIQHEAIDLAPDEIPDHLDLTAKLDIAMPQDKAQQVQTARILTDGENPLASMSYARQEILGIGQPDHEQKIIWGEQAANLAFRKYMIDQMLQLKMQEEQLFAPPQQQPAMQGQPGPGMQQPPMQGMNVPPEAGMQPQTGMEGQPSPFSPTQPMQPVPPVPA